MRNLILALLSCLALIDGVPAYGAEDDGVFFCNANIAPYHGSDLLLTVKKRGDEFIGQVVKLQLGLHSEIDINLTSIVFEERLSNAGNGRYEGAVFNLSVDEANLMSFDSANWVGDGAINSDYIVNGSASFDLSQFSINRAERFHQLNCRTGTFEERVRLKGLFHFLDSWANESFSQLSTQSEILAGSIANPLALLDKSSHSPESSFAVAFRTSRGRLQRSRLS